MSALSNGFAEVLNLCTFLWICVGVTLGYVLGVLPGLGRAMGGGASIPLTFYLKGGVLSTLVLICLAAPMARYALLIGPVDLCTILVFSMTFIGGLSD